MEQRVSQNWSPAWRRVRKRRRTLRTLTLWTATTTRRLRETIRFTGSEAAHLDRRWMLQTSECSHRRRYNCTVSSPHSESTEEEENICRCFSDIGISSSLRWTSCIPRSGNTSRTVGVIKEPIRFGTTQKGGQIQTVRGTHITLQVMLEIKDLDLIEMMFALDKTAVPRTQELQRDALLIVQPLVFQERSTRSKWPAGSGRSRKS